MIGAFVGAAHATTFNVNNGNDLESTISNAEDGDEIVITGTLTPPINLDTNQSIPITKAITIRGSTDNIRATINGSNFTDVPLFEINNLDATLKYLNFTNAPAVAVFAKKGKIEYCDFKNNGGDVGAALLISGSVTVDWCEFHNNTAEEFGGAISVISGSPLIKHCKFGTSGVNQAILTGGAVDVRTTGMVKLENSLLVANTAVTGAAVFVEKGTITMTHCTVMNNTGGAAIRNSGGNVNLENTVVYGNSIQTSGAYNPTTSIIQGAEMDPGSQNFLNGGTFIPLAGKAANNTGTANKGSAGTGVEVDLRGVKREQPDDTPDIGAFEEGTTAYAEYSITVAVDASGGGTVSIDGDQTASGKYREDDSIRTLSNPDPGQEFVHWKDSTNTIISNNPSYTFKVEKNDALTGFFTDINYTITLDTVNAVTIAEAGGVYQQLTPNSIGGSITSATTANGIFSDNNATFQVSLTDGYELMGWVSGNSMASALSARNTLLGKLDAYLASRALYESDPISNPAPTPLQGGIAATDDYILPGEVNGSSVTFYRGFGKPDHEVEDEVLIPVFRLKKYYVTTSLTWNLYGLPQPSTGSAGVDLTVPIADAAGKIVKLIWDAPTGWVIDQEATTIGGQSIDYWLNKDPSYATNLDTYANDGFLEFVVLGDMPTDLLCAVVMRPKSFVVTVNPHYEIDGLSAEVGFAMPTVRFEGTALGENLGTVLDPLFKEGTYVEVGWAVTPAYSGQVEVKFVLSNGSIKTSSDPSDPLIIPNISDDVTVTANVRLRTFSVRHRIYQGNDSSAPYFETTSTHYAGSSVFVPQFEGHTGYLLKDGQNQITKDADGSAIAISSMKPGDPSYDYIRVDGNLTIVSYVEPNEYAFTASVEFQANPGDPGTPTDNGITAGSVSLNPPLPPSGKYPFGKDVNATAVAENGYEFSHWKGDGNTTYWKLTTISQTVDLQAVFKRKKHVVTFEVSGNGGFIMGTSRYGNGSPAAVAHGETVTINSDPDAGYYAKDDLEATLTASGATWESGSGSVTFTVMEPITVQATFIADVISDSDGDGLNNYVESLYGTSANSPDHDSDGIPDFWEVIDWSKTDENNNTLYDDAFWLDVRADSSAHGFIKSRIEEYRYDPSLSNIWNHGASTHLNPTEVGDKLHDYDFDGVDNLTEFLSRTNPFDPTTLSNVVDQGVILDTGLALSGFSFVTISVDPTISSGTPPGILNYSGQTQFENGKDLFVQIMQVSPGWKFREWTAGLSGKDLNGTITVNGDMQITARFEEDRDDDDGDNVSNFDELVFYGTDANKSDTDGDGIDDGVEVDAQDKIATYNVTGIFDPSKSDKEFFDYLGTLNLAAPSTDGSGSSSSSGSGSSSSSSSGSSGGASADTGLLYEFISGWFYTAKWGWTFATTSSSSVYSSGQKTWLNFQKAGSNPITFLQWDYLGNQWVAYDPSTNPANAGSGNFTLTINKKNHQVGGEVSPSPSTYSAGTIVTIEVKPNPGYNFIGWEGDHVSTDWTTSFPINKDMTVTAVFLSDAEVADLLD